MQNEPPLARLGHMIDAMTRIAEATGEIAWAAFEADWQKQWLVERGLEIISEASRHLPDELKARHPTIPWPKIAGIGNILRHGYQSVRPAILWRIVTDDLPTLERACHVEFDRAGGRDFQPWFG